MFLCQNKKYLSKQTQTSITNFSQLILCITQPHCSCFRRLFTFVGTAKISGRVHLAPIKIGGTSLNCTFTVMEKNLGDRNMEFLLGLDMLKRYQCIMDLKAPARLILRAGGTETSVEFLTEGELPESKGGRLAVDPTIEENENTLKRKREEESQARSSSTAPTPIPPIPPTTTTSTSSMPVVPTPIPVSTTTPSTTTTHRRQHRLQQQLRLLLKHN